MPSKKKKDEPASPETEPKASAEPEQEAQPEQPEAQQAEKAPETKPEEAADAAGELKAERDKYLRLMAEYDNYRKRSAKERENIYLDVRVDTITKFLPVYDNLERALAVETADEAFRKGVEMTFNQLLDVMKKLGVEPIEAKGAKFDPNMHNAVMHIEDESLGESEIVDEFQKGFKIGDKVIRFSMVKVAN